MKESVLVESVLKILAKAFPSRVGLHEPVFQGQEWSYVKECLDTGWVSSVGKFVDRFEKDLSDFTGTRSVSAVANGTAALHLALLAVGTKPGDEVIVPTLTFVATANAVLYCGATPHFADSETLTLGMDAEKLTRHLKGVVQIKEGGCFNKKTGRRIAAMIPVHIFGHPADMDALKKVSEEFKIPLIEDSAEALGSFYKERHSGNIGLVSVLSFNGNKIVTTGGGGAVLTNDEELGRRLKHISTTAKIQHQWEFRHDQMGFNYRMPNINAALGCAQLEQLPKFIEKKRRLHDLYVKAFEPVKGAKLFHEAAFARSNYWFNVLILDSEQSKFRDAILDATNKNGIGTRPTWVLMHRLEFLKDSPQMDLSTAEDLERRIICLPSGAGLNFH